MPEALSQENPLQPGDIPSLETVGPTGESLDPIPAGNNEAAAVPVLPEAVPAATGLEVSVAAHESLQGAFAEGIVPSVVVEPAPDHAEGELSEPVIAETTMRPASIEAVVPDEVQAVLAHPSLPVTDEGVEALAEALLRPGHDVQ